MQYLYYSLELHDPPDIFNEVDAVPLELFRIIGLPHDEGRLDDRGYPVHCYRLQGKVSS